MHHVWTGRALIAKILRSLFVLVERAPCLRAHAAVTTPAPLERLRDRVASRRIAESRIVSRHDSTSGRVERDLDAL